jgi:hypothetical protein
MWHRPSAPGYPPRRLRPGHQDQPRSGRPRRRPRRPRADRLLVLLVSTTAARRLGSLLRMVATRHIFRDNLRSAAMCLLAKGAGDRDVVVDYATLSMIKRAIHRARTDSAPGPLPALNACPAVHDRTRAHAAMMGRGGLSWWCRQVVGIRAACVGRDPSRSRAPEAAVCSVVGCFECSYAATPVAGSTASVRNRSLPGKARGGRSRRRRGRCARRPLPR